MSRGAYYKTAELYGTQSSIPPSSLLTDPPPLRKPLSVGPPVMEVKYEIKEFANSGDPEVWGPAFWFSMHNGAARYPVQATPLWRSRMKNFILGIPVMVPCEKCSDHATAYLEKHARRLDEVVGGREKLFDFFVEFHNFVNQRLDKASISLQEARKLYAGKTDVLHVTYGSPGHMKSEA